MNVESSEPVGTGRNRWIRYDTAAIVLVLVLDLKTVCGRATMTLLCMLYVSINIMYFLFGISFCTE